MVSPASSPDDRGSISPTTATNTFAATARDDPAGLIGMGNTTMASSCLVDEVYTLGTRGVPGGNLTPDRNGGGEGRLRGTAALIGMGVMQWNPAVVVPTFKGVGIKVPDCFKGRKTVQPPGHAHHP